MTASTAKCARTDPCYAAALIAALRLRYPRLHQHALAAKLGISWRHLRKLERMGKAMDLPLQLQLESHLDPAVVDELRERFPNPPPPFWVARFRSPR